MRRQPIHTGHQNPSFLVCKYPESSTRMTNTEDHNSISNTSTSVSINSTKANNINTSHRTSTSNKYSRLHNRKYHQFDVLMFCGEMLPLVPINSNSLSNSLAANNLSFLLSHCHIVGHKSSLASVLPLAS